MDSSEPGNSKEDTLNGSCSLNCLETEFFKLTILEMFLSKWYLCKTVINDQIFNKFERSIIAVGCCC